MQREEKKSTGRASSARGKKKRNPLAGCYVGSLREMWLLTWSLVTRHVTEWLLASSKVRVSLPW